MKIWKGKNWPSRDIILCCTWGHWVQERNSSKIIEVLVWPVPHRTVPDTSPMCSFSTLWIPPHQSMLHRFFKSPIFPAKPIMAFTAGLIPQWGSQPISTQRNLARWIWAKEGRKEGPHAWESEDANDRVRERSTWSKMPSISQLKQVDQLLWGRPRVFA